MQKPVERFFEPNETLSTVSDVQPEPETSGLHTQEALSHAQLLNHQLQQECQFLQQHLRHELGACSALKAEHQQQYARVWTEAEEVGVAKEKAAWTARAQALRARHAAAAAQSTQSTEVPSSSSKPPTEQQTTNLPATPQMSNLSATPKIDQDSLQSVEKLQQTQMQTTQADAFHSQLEEKIQELEAMQAESRTELETQLQQSQLDLQHAQVTINELLPLQAEFKHAQADFQHTQAAFEHEQSDFQHVQAEFQQTQAECRHTQADVQHTKRMLIDSEWTATQFKEEFQHTQAELRHTQADFEHTQRMLVDSGQTAARFQEEFQHTHAEVQHMQAELRHTMADFQNTQRMLVDSERTADRFQEEFQNMQAAKAELRHTQADFQHAQRMLVDSEQIAARYQEEFRHTQADLHHTQMILVGSEQTASRFQDEMRELVPLRAELGHSEGLLLDSEAQMAQIQGQLHALQEIPWRAELQHAHNALLDSEEMARKFQEELSEAVPKETMEKLEAIQMEQFQEEVLHSQQHLWDSEQKILQVEERSADELEHKHSELQRAQVANLEMALRDANMECQLQESLAERSEQGAEVQALSNELAHVQENLLVCSAKLNAHEAVKQVHLKHAVYAEKAAQNEVNSAIDRSFRVELAISLAAAEGNAEPAVRESAARAENCLQLARKEEDEARKESYAAARSFQAMREAATGVAEAAEAAEASATEEVRKSKEDESLAHQEVSALREELAGIHASGILDNRPSEVKTEAVQTYITVASDFTVVDQKTVAGWQVELARWRSECATLRAECQVARLQRSFFVDKTKEEGPRVTLGLRSNNPMQPALPEKTQYRVNPTLGDSDWEMECASMQAEIAELQSECAALSMQEEAMLQQVSLELVQAIENAEDREAMRNAEHEDMISQLQTCLQQAEEQMNVPPTLEHHQTLIYQIHGVARNDSFGSAMHAPLSHSTHKAPGSDAYDLPPTSLGPIAHDTSNG